MKTAILGVLIVLCFGFGQSQNNTPTESDFDCVLTASKQVYSLGEVPKFQVSIVNNSGEDVYLIGSLDGSDAKFRMPFCYFTLEKPKIDSVRYIGRCGMVDFLSEKDFIFVPSGESFSPFHNTNGSRFWYPYEIGRPEHFRNLGVYRITFHYTSNSSELEDFLGTPFFGAGEKTSLRKLRKLFKKTPKIELQSNTVEIEIVE